MTKFKVGDFIKEKGKIKFIIKIIGIEENTDMYKLEVIIDEYLFLTLKVGTIMEDRINFIDKNFKKMERNEVIMELLG